MEVPSTRFDFAKEEEKILELWNQLGAFEKSLKLSEGRPRYSFYDGPPFATGLPHYGHILAGTIKDIVTRYATMTGYYVERRFGWDCHGLPVEYEIDKTLGITGRHDVLKMGIANYNAECRGIVMRYSSEWEVTVKRMGRWIDFQNDYKTLNPSFMESVWWVFKQLFEKNLVYRGYRVMPYSTGCTTPLSNFEAGQNYKDVADPAVIVSFPLVDQPNVSVLAWTTTPWTLPSNLALCANPEFTYVQLKDVQTQKEYILLEERIDSVYADPKKYTVLKKMKGSDLKGLAYVPLFEYYSSRKNNFVILNDGYVTNESGTGIVHQAPAFGEDDYRVCLSAGIIKEDEEIPCPIDDSGIFVAPVEDFKGMYVKDADKEIIKLLKSKNRVIKVEQYRHSYPFCWRSETPLIYKIVPCWFVRVKDNVQKLLANNQKTYWVPDFVKEKRFHNWLENARDWNISRNRFWGTPIPLWVSDDYTEMVCVGSIQELEELSGVKGIKDLHRESIDGLTIPSKTGKGVLRRIDEVFDCWFESGSMPYAKDHYPFENKEMFENAFPANFIAEGLDQTRGWFYTLMVLSTLLFDKPAFQNLIVSGLVLAEDGKKMSKRLKNYPDPSLIFDSYGADALRLYLINSPVVRAETLRFKEEGVKGIVRDVLLPLYNVFKFFITQTNDKKSFKFDENLKSTNYMDKWILASCQSLLVFVKNEMGAYRLYTVVPRLLKFIEDLSNWYLRFNRKRLRSEFGEEDGKMALNTLCDILLAVCKLMASFTPFITEYMYQSLKGFYKAANDNESIHFSLIPEANEAYFNKDIERAVKNMQVVIELGRFIREQHNISLKTPLNEVIVVSVDEQVRKDVEDLKTYILEELNCRTLTITGNEEEQGIKYNAVPNYKVLGQKLRGDLPKVKKLIQETKSDQWKDFLKTGKISFMGYEFTEEDIQVSREVTKRENMPSKVENDVVVILDISLNSELKYEGLAREIINRVQKLRKKANLNQSDQVKVSYSIEKDDEEHVLETVFNSQAAVFEKVLKVVPVKGSASEKEIIAQEVFNLEEMLTVCMTLSR